MADEKAEYAEKKISGRKLYQQVIQFSAFDWLIYER